jgi:hypothetical protein
MRTYELRTEISTQGLPDMKLKHAPDQVISTCIYIWKKIAPFQPAANSPEISRAVYDNATHVTRYIKICFYCHCYVQ